VAAVALVAAARDNGGSIGTRLLADLRTVFGAAEKLSTEDILTALCDIDEAPWGDIRGKALDARGLSRRLAKYGVKPKNVRIGASTPKGYDRGELHDAWGRYLPPNVADTEDKHTKSDTTHPEKEARSQQSAPPLAPASATSATSATAPTPHCTRCGQELLLVVAGRDVCAACSKAGAA